MILNMKNVLKWSPRAIAFAYLLFLATLSLDAFGGEGSFGQKVLGFLIHLTPAFAVGGFLFLAWKFPLVGGLFFMVLGMVFTIYYHTDRSLPNFLLISMPLFLAGLLFIFSHSSPEKN